MLPGSNREHDMVTIQVIGRGGDTHTISAAPGMNLMEALRDNGIDEVLALCGGCCSCATCQVYVEAGPAEAQTTGSADEDDLLDGSDHRQANSRLSCQLMLAGCHDGLVVRIAPE
jgi:2Fe-2S ferredoxin